MISINGLNAFKHRIIIYEDKGNLNNFEEDTFSYLLSRFINNVNRRSYSLETYYMIKQLFHFQNLNFKTFRTIKTRRFTNTSLFRSNKLTYYVRQI